MVYAKNGMKMAACQSQLLSNIFGIVHVGG